PRRAVEAGEGAGDGGATESPRRVARCAPTLPRRQGGEIAMKRRKTQGMGRLFKRRSRHTGKLLPTWWIGYSADGTPVRESANTEDRQAALDLLRERLKALSDGTAVDPARERLTVDEILDGLLAFY